MTVHGVPSPPHAHVASGLSDRTFGRELCRRHAEALARMASLMLGDDTAADDVVSDAIAAVCRADDQPHRHDVTLVHLARSVYSRCLGRLATHERFSFDSAPHRGRRFSMTDDQRAVVALVLFGGHDLAQAAATLNRSPAVVTGHLRAAAAIIGR